jgi:2,4-dienoyl-CoA reductase [(3E)-enoyl-CoA-producing], peroxisomal
MSPHPVFRDDLLAGQVGIVTGGATGIGLGISTTLAQLGMHVVLASRKLENLQPAVDAIVASGGKASAVAVDVREQARVQAMVKQVHDELGRIDLLVNNAAGNFYKKSEELSENAWKSVIEIDLYGTFFCTQAVFPYMKAQGGGRVVSTSMTLHYRGWPLMAHATAAKAGVDALTRTLAVEWAEHGIRVNAIAPGPIPTDGVRKAFTPPPGAPVPDFFSVDKAMDAFAKNSIPLKRWGTPDDIGQMVAYLASSAGDWITGSIFVIDGGEWLAKSKTGM